MIIIRKNCLSVMERHIFLFRFYSFQDRIPEFFLSILIGFFLRLKKFYFVCRKDNRSSVVSHLIIMRFRSSGRLNIYVNIRIFFMDFIKDVSICPIVSFGICFELCTGIRSFIGFFFLFQKIIIGIMLTKRQFRARWDIRVWV